MKILKALVKLIVIHVLQSSYKNRFYRSLWIFWSVRALVII